MNPISINLPDHTEPDDTNMKTAFRTSLFPRFPGVVRRSAATSVLTLLACAWPNLGQAQYQSGPTGTFPVRETWTVTIAENNGQTPAFSKTYRGTTTGTLVVSNGEYTLIDRTGLPASSIARLHKARNLYDTGIGYEIDGSYPVVGFAGNYAVIELSFFLIRVQLPVTDFAIPALSGGGNNHYVTTGDSLNSLSASGNERDQNTGFTASAYSSSSLSTAAPPGTIAPRITASPRSQSVSLGGNLTLSVSANGTEPLSYQWTHNGVNVVDGGEFDGSSTAILTIQGVQATDAGTYRVVVSNAKGSTSSAPATLTIGASLGIDINGPGTVTPDYNGQALAVGKKYTVTAKPATGCKFVGWTGSANSGSAKLTFTMEPGLSFTANFADVTRPVLKILYPKARQSLTSPVVSPTGRSSDNVGVAAVYYQLNSGDWTLAEGTTTWSISNLALVPGVNVLHAYALDAAGNASLTNTVNLTYLVSAPLSVTVSPPGGGVITPNYNGHLLQIGRTYSITAKPAKGFSFVNWTGSAETTSSRLSFVMAPNLTFTANFKDTQPPLLTVLYPKTGQTVTSSAVTVAGKVSDNVGVADVFYSLNGSTWAPAQTTNHWTNWTAQVNLAPGANTISAYAQDLSGNLSLTTTVNLFCKQSLSSFSDADWAALGPDAGVDPISGEVEALACDDSGNLYAASLTKTSPYSSVVAEWDGHAWNTLLRTGGMVSALACDRSGNLYAGGDFGISMWNGSAWSNVLSAGAEIYALVCDSSGNLYAGGGNYIAKWKAGVWTPLGSGVSGGGIDAGDTAIYALALDRSGNLYAGGQFTRAGGVAATNVARWNGAAWSAPGSGINADGWVSALASDTKGNLYVGGDFGTAGGITAIALARWNGSRWSTVGTWRYGPYYQVDSLVCDSSGNLYVGGSFNQAGNVSANCIAQWNGNTWSALGAGMSGGDSVSYTDQGAKLFGTGVYALALDGFGNLYAGGNFYTAGTNAALYVAEASLRSQRTPSTAGTRAKVQDQWWASTVGMVKNVGVTGTSENWELSRYAVPGNLSSARNGRISRPRMLRINRPTMGNEASRETPFGVYFTGPPGQVVIVESSADLVHWKPVQTNTITAGPLYFSDPQWTNQPCRFYRVSTP